MVPSSRYFPSSLGARADWYNNFATQFALVATALGFTLSEVTSVEDDNLLMQFLVNANDQMNAVIDAARQFRTVMTEGVPGSPEAIWPTQFAGMPPLPLVPVGLFQRLDDLVKRIRVSPAYSPEIGALLGIIPSGTPETDPADMKPNPSLRAEPGNVIIVEFTRGKSDGIDVQMMLDNSGNWEHAGRFYKPPANIVIPQGVQALPRAVQIRARYVIGDDIVGQYSDIDTISTIP